jgi:ABC-type oligopeptide transport system substrate-binding subunit
VYAILLKLNLPRYFPHSKTQQHQAIYKKIHNLTTMSAAYTCGKVNIIKTGTARKMENQSHSVLPKKEHLSSTCTIFIFLRCTDMQNISGIYS